MNALLAGLVMLSLAAAAVAAGPAPPGADDGLITLPGSPLGIAWTIIYGYGPAPAVTFLPAVRQLGAGFTKLDLFWNQLEPEKGRYDWSALDAFINQLQSPEEGLICLFSSSQWATRRAATMLPPSPAKDLEEYYRFIHDLVKHCRGRVRYWQMDNEPNSPTWWSGTKEEFVAQLKVFHRAVKAADPAAVVVVGGYDGLFNPPGLPSAHKQEVGLAFFDYVFAEGRDAFDVFDLHLYLDPYTIPGRVQYMREMMRAHGYDKPIIATEYGGPNLFEFPENRPYAALVHPWMQSVQEGDLKSQPVSPITQLYEQMSTLPPQTQMFMLGCSPALEAKYQRIQSRSLVMRNLLGFSAGVQKMTYWDLPNVHGDRDDLMTLMYGKIGLLGLENATLGKRTPSADVYQRMAEALHGVRRVTQIAVSADPSIFLFQIDRGARGLLSVVWQKRDAFSGEDAPTVAFTWPWTAKSARAVDAFGVTVPLQVKEGRLSLAVSLTPIYIEPGN